MWRKIFNCSFKNCVSWGNVLEEIILNFLSPSLKIFGSCSYSNANIVKRMTPIFIQSLLVFAFFLALAMLSTVACCSKDTLQCLHYWWCVLVSSDYGQWTPNIKFYRTGAPGPPLEFSPVLWLNLSQAHQNLTKFWDRGTKKIQE